MHTIFKLCRASEWAEAERSGTYPGSPVDLRDGYIHFSTAQQVAETAAKHFAGVDGLTLLAVDADTLGSALRWEPSRGGALFPHLYGQLPVAQVLWVQALRLDPTGRHVFPDLHESSRLTHSEGHREWETATAGLMDVAGEPVSARGCGPDRRSWRPRR